MQSKICNIIIMSKFLLLGLRGETFTGRNFRGEKVSRGEMLGIYFSEHVIFLILCEKNYCDFDIFFLSIYTFNLVILTVKIDFFLHQIGFFGHFAKV